MMAVISSQNDPLAASQDDSTFIQHHSAWFVGHPRLCRNSHYWPYSNWLVGLFGKTSSDGPHCCTHHTSYTSISLFVDRLLMQIASQATVVKLKAENEPDTMTYPDTTWPLSFATALCIDLQGCGHYLAHHACEACFAEGHLGL